MIRLSARDRRTLLVGAAGMAAIIIMGKALPAARREADRRAEAGAALAEQVAGARARYASRTVIADSLRARQDRLAALRRMLLNGRTPQLAAVRLSTILAELANASGASVNSSVVRADQKFVDSVARVSVRLSVSTDLEGLTTLLHLVETDGRAFAVRELAVGNADVFGTSEKPHALTADLLIDAPAFESRGPAKGAR